MWVEIYERGERMFANLGTGECQWDAPQGQPVKQANFNQWWELFDHSTSRFYYYNAFKMMTVWHRPSDADIVPLARFQLKQKELKEEGTIKAETIGTDRNGISSAGHSTSSREDLIEEQIDGPVPISHGPVPLSQQRYGQNVTRFGSIQPNRTLHQYAKSNVTQSATNLQHKKVLENHTRSASCAPEPFDRKLADFNRPTSVQEMSKSSTGSKTGSIRSHRTVTPLPVQEPDESDTAEERVPGVGAEQSPNKPETETGNETGNENNKSDDASTRGIKRQFSASVMSPVRPSPTNPESNMRRTYSVLSNSKKDNKLATMDRKSVDSNFGVLANNALQLNRGFMKRPISVSDLLSYQRKAPKKPLTNSNSKVVLKECGECFKLVIGYISSLSEDLSPKPIIKKGWTDQDLANEIYAIIIKQTRNNPDLRETLRGFELLAICLFFFSPVGAFKELIHQWIQQNTGCSDIPQLLLQACSKRLVRIISNGNRRGLLEPGEREIVLSKRHIYQRSMFGVTFNDLQEMQKDKFPELEVPWIQVALTREIIRLGGLVTEGIFRLAGELDRVTALKVKVEDWEVYDEESDDPHIACSLLKLWLREMAEPLFPTVLAEQFLDASEDSSKCVELVSKLPEVNRRCLLHLLRFLQVFSALNVIQVTRMDASNLAMVMAPNLFRPLSDDPRILLDNSRREINFLSNLIEKCETSEAAQYDTDFRVDQV